MIAAAIVAHLMSGEAVVAVGFFIVLAVAMVLDFVFSAVGLVSRPVSLVTTRRITSPPEPLTFVASAAPKKGVALDIVVQRITAFDEDGDFTTLDLPDASVEIALPGRSAKAANHVRYRVAATLLGLVWARRWEVQEVPMLHRAAGPDGDVEVNVGAVDELTRLREYVPGDRMGRISWPTTARTGRLHVRDEGLGDDEVTVVVDLGGDLLAFVGDVHQADVVIERAATVVDRLLSQGSTVRLVTYEMRRTFFDAERDAALRRPGLVGRTDLKVHADSAATLGGMPAGEIVSALVSDRTELTRRLSMAEHHPAMAHPAPPHVLVDPAGVHSVA